MNKPKTISDIEREFDEDFGGLSCVFNDWTGDNIFNSEGQRPLNGIKNFYREQFKALLDTMPIEETPNDDMFDSYDAGKEYQKEKIRKWRDNVTK